MKRNHALGYALTLSIILIVGLFLTGCSTENMPDTKDKQQKPVSEKKDIIVSAAASLKNVMTEIKKIYEEQNPGINLTFNYGSSGSLQKQIEQGAPADVFLSAGTAQIDVLEKGNLLTSGTRTDFCANQLVLVVVVNSNTITDFKDLIHANRISIGTPESVPAGKYAQEALINMSLWNSLQPKLVLAKDVTQVLTYVESENVEAGIVYRSDAHESSKVRIVAAAPEDSHSPIIYPGAVIAASKNQMEAKAFLGFITSSQGQAVFQKYGFKGIP